MLSSKLTTLTAKAAVALDQELMSTGAYTLDQLMEIAGLSVAQSVYKQYPPQIDKSKILVLVGPGNNGGDGLVAARHLKLWGGYDPVLYYPKKSAKNELYGKLLCQLRDLDIDEIETIEQVKEMVNQTSSKSNVSLIIDALFGFSFKPPIRPPFDELLSFLSDNHLKIAPIVSIDIPSGWDVENGPTLVDINPTMLVSLTAPKPCAIYFSGNDKTHYLGGRFINNKIAKKYNIEDLPKLYKGSDLIVKL